MRATLVFNGLKHSQIFAMELFYQNGSIIDVYLGPKYALVNYFIEKKILTSSSKVLCSNFLISPNRSSLIYLSWKNIKTKDIYMLHNCIFSFRTKQWINKHLEQSVSLLFNNSTIYGNLLAGKFAIIFFPEASRLQTLIFWWNILKKEYAEANCYWTFLE